MSRLWRVLGSAAAAAALTAGALTSPTHAANGVCSGPPPTPTNLRATADGTNVRFTWDPSPGATEYLIWWDEVPPGGDIPVTTTTYSIPASYERGATLFQLSARNACGQSAGTYITPPSRLPYAPGQVQAFPGKRSLLVTWMPSDPRGNQSLSEVHYKVTTQPGGRTCQVDSASALSCIVTGLTLGQRYTASVVAFNELGTTEAASTPKAVQIVVGPSAPRAVEAETGITTATVSWKPPTFDGGRPVVRYIVTSAPGGRTCTTRKGSCRLTGLNPGSPYQFVVVADNGRAKGSPALSFPMSTQAPPTAPAPDPEPTPTPKPSSPIS